MVPLLETESNPEFSICIMMGWRHFRVSCCMFYVWKVFIVKWRIFTVSHWQWCAEQERVAGDPGRPGAPGAARVSVRRCGPGPARGARPPGPRKPGCGRGPAGGRLGGRAALQVSQHKWRGPTLAENFAKPVLTARLTVSGVAADGRRVNDWALLSGCHRCCRPVRPSLSSNPSSLIVRLLLKWRWNFSPSVQLCFEIA